MSKYVNTWSTLSLGIIFPVICTVSVALRFAARWSVDSRYGPDDWTAVAALIFTLGCGAIMIYGAATKALGWTPAPGVELPPSTMPSAPMAELFVKTEKLKYPFLLLSIIALGLIRLTFVLLYTRIFEHKRFKLFARLMMVIIISWMISFFFALLFTCGSNFGANFGDTEALIKYCHGEFGLDNAMALSDVVIDVMILLLPVVPMYGLQMSLRRKLLILLVFSLGVFSIMAGLARTVLSVLSSRFKYGSSGVLFGIEAMADPTGVVSVIQWWAYVEVGIGCFVSNLPPTIGLLRGHGKTMRRLLQSKLLAIGGRASTPSRPEVAQVEPSAGLKARGWFSLQLSEVSDHERV